MEVARISLLRNMVKIMLIMFTRTGMARKMDLSNILRFAARLAVSTKSRNMVTIIVNWLLGQKWQERWICRAS